jgi:hypothetical protein
VFSLLLERQLLDIELPFFDPFKSNIKGHKEDISVKTSNSGIKSLEKNSIP